MDDDAIASSIDRGVASLRRAQREEGDWLDGRRDLATHVAYAAALIACGHDPSSDRLRLVCDAIAKGPARAEHPAAELLLRHVRPAAARGGELPRMDPPSLLLRWELEGRTDALLQDATPRRWLQRLATTVAPVAPRWARRPLDGWRTWDVAWDEPTMLALRLAAQHGPLARDRDGAVTSARAAVAGRIFDDGSVAELAEVFPLLVCLRALGRSDDEARVRGAVERITMEDDRVVTCMAGDNVRDTARAHEALRAAGTPADDLSLQRAVAFLRRAQRPDGGWARAWSASQGSGQRDRDPAATAAARLVVEAQAAGHDGDASPASIARTILGGTRDEDALASSLVARQELNGLWLDPDVDPLTTTHLALDALVSTGRMEIGDPSVERALNALVRSQNIDGGWRFDRTGARQRSSDAGQTGAAVRALSTFTRETARPMAGLAHAVRHLLERQRSEGGWSTSEETSSVLLGLVAYRALRTAYLPTAPRLVRAQRLAEKRAGREQGSR